MRRPPYLRWFAAGLLVAIGLLIETHPAATQPYPFTAADIAPGQQIAAAIEWREVPTGLMPSWEGDVQGPAAVAIPAGSPLLPSATVEITVPADWWKVPVPLPVPVTPGASVLIALGDGAIIEGIAVESNLDDGFETFAMVAFAASDAPRVVRAAATDALVVMVGTAAGNPEPSG